MLASESWALPAYRVQGFYFQTRIICETVQAIFLVNIPGFLKGIPFERVLFLGDVFVALNLFQGNDLVLGAEHFFYFFQLVGIVGSKN